MGRTGAFTARLTQGAGDEKRIVEPGTGIFHTDQASGHGLPLRLQPDVTESPVLLEAGTTVEARLSQHDGQTCWASVGAGERTRLRIPVEDDVWLRLTEDGVRKIAGRRGCGNDVWLERSLLEAVPPVELDPLAPIQQEQLNSECDDLPLATLESSLTEEILRQLQQEGFVVVDDALPQALCLQLRNEMQALLRHGQMWESESFASDEGAAHHDIEETQLEHKEVRMHAPTFARMETDDGLLRCLKRLPTLRGLSYQHVRIQVNHGNGGCYTMHTDSGYDMGAESQVLQATALFYLNPDWKSDDGGELRLFPFPRPPVTIPPMCGRLVLFEPRMVHEVLPNFKQRFCFTLWCSGREGGKPVGDFDMDALACEPNLTTVAALSEEGRRLQGVGLPYDETLPVPLRLLFLPEVRPLLVRFVWRACELEAIRKSHDSGMQKDEMLAGISCHHETTERMTPRWLLDLIESLPNAVPTDAERGSLPCAEIAEDPDTRDKVHIAELAAFIRSRTPWWS